MDLLEKASIILTPTAYNNGEALCVKPSDGSGDFDFSRNSAATRVNAQGLVENVQILSSNLVQNGDFSEEGTEEVSNGSFSQEGVQLVTNGDFATDSDWAKGTGWSISGGSANCDGTQTSGTNLIQNGLALGTNKIFKIEFELKDYQAGELIYVNLTGTGILEFENINANGTYVAYSGLSTGDNFITFRADADFIGSIDNVSVREVGQDWTLGTGWSIGEDKATFDETIGGAGNLNQSNILTVGKTYKLTFDTLETNGGNLAYAFGNNSVFINNIQADTTHVVYGVADDVFLKIRGASNFNGSITNISVKEVGQNWNLANVDFSLGAVYLDTSGDNVWQPFADVVGTLYKLTIVKSGSGILRLRTGFSGVDGTIRQIPSDGIVYFTATSNTNRIQFYGDASNTPLTLNSVSLVAVTTDTNLPRINYEGFSYQDALGSELITNGSFDNTIPIGTIGSGWAKVVDGTNIVEYSNGGVKLTRATTSECKLYAATLGGNTNVLTSGKTYKLTYEVMSVNGSVTLRYFSGSGYVTVSSQVGIHTLTFEQGAATGLSVFYNTTDNTDITIDNVSVKEYLGQEVVPDSGCGHWLWEPQSTNLITQSELFSDAIWLNSNSTDTSNYGISPDGLNNSTRFLTTANTGSFLYINSLPILDATNYTLSFWVKSNGNSLDKFRLYTTTGGTSLEFTSTNKWVRYEYNFLSTGTTTNLGIRGVVGQETDVQIWGAQFEQQTYATSYIPTSGSTVTRNQDVCNNGGSLASINSTQGTLYAEIAALANDGTFRMINISDGTLDNRVEISYYTSVDLIRVICYVNGLAVASKSNISANILDFNKIAFSYKENDFKVYLNGVNVYTNTSGAIYPTNTLNRIDFGLSSVSGFDFYGKTKALAVWKEALSDEELTELTTI